MDNRLLINQPVRPGKIINNKQINRKTNNDKEQIFKEVLAKQLEKNKELKFSRHAQNRLISRGIMLSKIEIDLLKNGIRKAEEKGSKDSLIIVNNIAYLVSVENNTVITAIDDKNIKENVFTNIDSAVFM